MSFDIADRQFITVNELHDAGYSKYKIHKMVEDGLITPINRKCYENTGYNGEINDFYAAKAYSGIGVICLLSAAVHYGLSSERPPAIEIALPRGTRIPPEADWPPMEYYRFSDFRYQLGIQTVTEGGNSYEIYDTEKTICDVVFYRNKIGFEPAMEVLKNYLNSQSRNINRLMEYAEKLKMKTSMKGLVEVLV